MSLEAAIVALTAAVQANTAALSGKKPSAADAAIEAVAAKKVSAEKKPATKSKGPTLDTIKERFGAYLGIEDKAERKVRAANVKAIVDHFGVTRAGELSAENWVEALGYLTQYENDEEVDFGNESEPEEDEDDPTSMV